MFDTLKKIFGAGPSADYAQLVKNGAIILDVRTPSEYSGGHIQGSINIPVDQLVSNLHRLRDKERPIITCCASGMRSGTAKNILEGKGYKQVYNGGGWGSLKSKL